MLVINNTWNVSTASSQQLIDTEKSKLADIASDVTDQQNKGIPHKPKTIY
jgi:hypothetical protein